MAGRIGLAALAVLGMGMLAPASWAQERDQSASGTEASASPPQPASEASRTVPIMLGAQRKQPQPWQPFADEGVSIALNYTGEAAGNVTGGLRRKAAHAGQLYIGADLDLDRIAGIGGGALHFAVTNRHGDNLSQIAIGNNTSVQEIWGTQNTHLAILTYEQKLLGGALAIEAGKSQANIHFLNSPIYCNFQSNSACGNPTFVFKNSNFTYFPASSWMAHARLSVTPRVWAHVGVYEVNPDRRDPNDDGFSFSARNATGVIVPWEIGYSTKAADERLPRNYIIGGWFDRADYADPLRDADGGIAILTGRSAATRHGRSGIYIRFDQMLTRPDPRSDRGLTLFGVAMTNLSGRVEERRFLELGLVQNGTFRGRDQDTIGFVVNQQSFSDLAMERMRAARIAAGGDGNVRRNQYMMELAYGAQIGPAIRVSPNVQYILHPDQTGAPFRTSNIGNALIFGFKFTVDAPTLLAMTR